MAGHSKWSQIKRSKAIKDAKKGAAAAKCSREMIVAAKLGGGDPAANFRLRTAIDRAKAAGLTNDVIQRAIQKGTGALGSDEPMLSLFYEGYGPGGVAILVEAMSENRNRTAGDIRSYFNKYNGSFGAEGSVAWMFDERGLIRFPLAAVKQQDEAYWLEQALEAGAIDMTLEMTPETDADTEALWVEIVTQPTQLNAVCTALTLPPQATAETMRIPKTQVQLADTTKATQLLKLLDALEDHDDVQQVSANVVWPENFNLI